MPAALSSCSPEQPGVRTGACTMCSHNPQEACLPPLACSRMPLLIFLLISLRHSQQPSASVILDSSTEVSPPQASSTWSMATGTCVHHRADLGDFAGVGKGQTLTSGGRCKSVSGFQALLLPNIGGHTRQSCWLCGSTSTTSSCAATAACPGATERCCSFKK